VLSRAYQLSAEAPSALVAVDPANRLVWRHAPRRLEAEEIRDAMLAAAGTLDLSRPTASPAKDLRVVELPNNGPIAKRLGDEALKSTHRSVYLPLLRGLTPRSLEVFDFAEQGMVTGSRDSTTVATQALYMLNDPFVRRQSLALAERLLKPEKKDDADRIRLAYQLALGRAATDKDIERAKKYVAEYEAAEREAAKAVPEKKSQPPAEKAPPTEKPKPEVPVNPDDIPRVDEPVKEEAVKVADPKTAAWASFCQALLGSAEFRYVR
jgi:hypothetical protein